MTFLYYFGENTSEYNLRAMVVEPHIFSDGVILTNYGDGVYETWDKGEFVHETMTEGGDLGKNTQFCITDLKPCYCCIPL